MNFNQNNVFGTILGAITALWGYLTGGVYWTVITLSEVSLNHVAAIVGTLGVMINLYFAWSRHRREVLVFEYETGQREDRRHRPTRTTDIEVK